MISAMSGRTHKRDSASVISGRFNHSEHATLRNAS
jgi:hypothetical protein